MYPVKKTKNKKQKPLGIIKFVKKDLRFPSGSVIWAMPWKMDKTLVAEKKWGKVLWSRGFKRYVAIETFVVW